MSKREKVRETLAELWRYRELLYFFAWRDIKVRYRQAALGAAWAVIQPLLTMVIFTLIFGKVAHISTGGIPYPLFVFSGLLPWTYISGVLAFASMSLINNNSLLTKVYFPRVFLPTASVLAGLLDFAISAVLLLPLMIWYRVSVGWTILMILPLMIAMVLLTTGVSMAISALNVRYRDVRYALPFIIQVWMFLTPIVYPISVIPRRLRFLLVLNPCWGIVDGFRACLFRGWPLNFHLISLSLGIAVLVFILSVVYFRSAEKNFADII